MKNRRALWLLLAALFALTAFPAAASASGGIEADSYPTTINGTAKGQQSFVVGTATPTTCSMGALEEAPAISEPAAVVKAKPVWASCSETVSNAGCKLEFRAGTENSFDIGPAGCGPITVKVAGCSLSVGAQTGKAATYENVGSGSGASVRVKIGVALKYTGDGKLGCPSGSAEDLSYIGEWELYGRSNVGNEVGIHAVDGFNGFFMASGPARFDAEELPISVAGSQEASSPFTISLNGGKVTCNAAQFSATLSQATSNLPVNASLSDCAFGGQTGIVVDMNSCYFSYSAKFTSPFFHGETSIGCSEPGDAIEVVWPQGGYCVAKFASQSPGGGSNLYLNQGSGASRYVKFLTGGSAKFAYTREGFCQILGKNGSNGNFTGNFELHGP